jgi:hypothetical protein
MADLSELRVPAFCPTSEAIENMKKKNNGEKT